MPKEKVAQENTNNYWLELTTLPSQTITNEQEKSLVAKFAKKYNVAPGKVRFSTKKLLPEGFNPQDSAINAAMINNIRDPKFHVELYKEYIKQNGIKDYNWDEILNIDSRVNALINYDAYEKGRRFELRYARWKNFLSYGEESFFDFTKLHGLTLLKGDPGNKSGKSTFAYDVIHFGLFGKTRSGKADKFSELFNNYRPNERELFVELGITIGGENYVIRRTLTKPDPKKKTKIISNSVAYYRVNGDGTTEQLKDSDNLQGETTTKTTKAIKEAIGSEEDFDRIISANAKDLDELISMKDTDRGRVLARWIGLLPIEDKEARAKEMWAKSCTGRLCDIYDRETLKTEIADLEAENEENGKQIEANKVKSAETNGLLTNDSNTKDILLTSKQKVDDELLNIDLNTVETRINKVIEDGKKKAGEIEALAKEIAEYGEIEYSDSEDKKLFKRKDELTTQIASIKAEMKLKKKQAEHLENDEYCPTCHQKWPDKDNSAAIAELKKEYDADMQTGIQLRAELDEVEAKIKEHEEIRNRYFEKGRKEIKLGALKNEKDTLLSEYKRLKKISDSYKDNKDAIMHNNEIDAQVNVLNANIEAYNGIIRRLENDNVALTKDIEANNKSIAEKNTSIKRIEEEVESEKNWKLYLSMVGKDGIAKMVLKNTIPSINSELYNLLFDVVDFNVEVEVTEKNDIEFWLVRDGVKTRLAGGSGLERTMAALALRVVLGKMSNLSKPPFIVLDEILGSVAAENYDDVKKLYDKIALEYDFILHICHIDLDWYDNIIMVTKKNNISTISMD